MSGKKNNSLKLETLNSTVEIVLCKNFETSKNSGFLSLVEGRFENM